MLRINEVGPGHRDVLLVLLGQFQPVEDDVEIAAVERGNKLVPLVLHHLCADAEFGGERFGEIDLEAD